MVDALTQKLTNIVKYQSAGGEIELSIEDVKSVFCPKATDIEARLFLEVCRYQGLNPFLREVYLIKYQEGEPASIVVGKEVFTKRAQRIESCIGWEAGVLVSREGLLVEQEGSFLLPGDTLLGGWVRVDRQGQDPFKHRVALEEYIQTTRQGQPTRFWAKMPATMIRKVAIVQGLRECYPEEFQGLYDTAEITGGEIIDVTGHAVAQLEGAPTSVIRVPEKEAPPRTAGDGNNHDHPWLLNCPIHNIAWFQTQKMREPAHKQEGQGMCNQGQTLTPLLSKKLEQMTSEWDNKAVNPWLKLHHGGTWSTFSAKQKIDILTQLKTTPVNGIVTEPTASDGSPVDTETGAIMDTTAPRVEAPVETPVDPAAQDDGAGVLPGDEQDRPTGKGSEPDWQNDPLRKS